MDGKESMMIDLEQKDKASLKEMQDNPEEFQRMLNSEMGQNELRQIYKNFGVKNHDELKKKVAPLLKHKLISSILPNEVVDFVRFLLSQEVTTK